MGVLRNYVRTILNGITLNIRDLEDKLGYKADRDEIVQPVQSDWNVNDVESDAYVKNRPFYEIATPTIFYETDSALESGQAAVSLGAFDHPFIDRETYVVISSAGKEEITCVLETDGLLYLYATKNTGHNKALGSIYQDPNTLQTWAFSWWTARTPMSITGTLYDIKHIPKRMLPDVFVGVKTDGGGEAFNDGDCTASGQYSHAEGYMTIASGKAAHAEGIIYGTSSVYGAIGEASHVEGRNTKASGDYSHAEGFESAAEAEGAHAEGDSKASGEYSHAEGFRTTANGEVSHAEGYYTVANGQYQHVQGRYNVIDNDDVYAHIVGNGTNTYNRKNIHTLGWNGLAWFSGGLQVGGKAQNDGAKNVLLEGDAIPVPATATTGQILAVKAVGANGKPTEWEVIDAPIGGGSGYPGDEYINQLISEAVPDVPTDAYINSLIDAKLNAIPNAAEVAY